MAGCITTWVNIAIEQICGTCFGGCAEAMAQWIPHLAKTIFEPILGKNLQKLIGTCVGK